MKLPHSDSIIWWRAGIIAAGIVFASLALFSFLLYQRVAMIASKPAVLPAQEPPVLFSPRLLDDAKAFWEKRGG